MKPSYTLSLKPDVHSALKAFLFVMVLLVITSFFTSCTADEIEVLPKKETAEETYLQRNDSIPLPSPSNSTTTPNTTNGGTGTIDPPKVPPPPPHP